MTILLGEKINADSWVVGVKVFADHIWQKVLSGEYQSFCIGGRGLQGPERGPASGGYSKATQSLEGRAARRRSADPGQGLQSARARA